MLGVDREVGQDLRRRHVLLQKLNFLLHDAYMGYRRVSIKARRLHTPESTTVSPVPEKIHARCLCRFVVSSHAPVLTQDETWLASVSISMESGCVMQAVTAVSIESCAPARAVQTAGLSKARAHAQLNGPPAMIPAPTRDAENAICRTREMTRGGGAGGDGPPRTALRRTRPTRGL